MIDLFDLYNRFCSAVNTWQGGFFRPQTDFERAVNDINMDLWKDYTARAEKTQEVTDYLFPFTKSKNVIVNSKETAYGIATYPTDYSRYSSARIIVGNGKCYPCKDVDSGKCEGYMDTDQLEEMKENYLDNIQEFPVEKIDNSRWGSATTHLTKIPTFESAKITQTNTGFKVAPRAVNVLVLDYYIQPAYVKFKYTKAAGNVQTGAGDQIIYDTTSDKLLWDITLVNEFLIRLGEKFGKFTRENFIFQTNNLEKKE